MADEPNIPTHRWYQPRNHIALPRDDVSRAVIKAAGIAKIDAWIAAQPWGSRVLFVPSGSDSLITADSLTFKVKEA